METGKVEIRGLDLRIDPAVYKLCEVYNSSAGSTRSVLYFMLLINILSLIAVINSHMHNWSDDRIASLDRRIQKATLIKQQELDKLRQGDTIAPKLLGHHKKMDSLDYILDLHKKVKEYNIKNKIDRYQNVLIPVLGNSFDINNLGIISGVSFIVLLIILRFTLTREKNNLRIALQSISERYVDDHIEKEFSEDIAHISGKPEEVVAKISLTRRKHHYNFLSMNEIFNLPMLEVSGNTLQKTFFGKLVTKWLFYFPYFIYLVIFVNDFITLPKGIETSFWHTIFSAAVSYLCLWMVSYLCKYCNVQKIYINNLFADFFDNNYRFVKTTERVKRDTIIQRLFYPFEPLFKFFVKLYQLLFK